MSLRRGLGQFVASVLASTAGTAVEPGPATAGAEGSPSVGLTAKEEAALSRAESVATLLDDAVQIPGTNFRVGLDPILGVAPVGGDAIAGFLSLYPVFEAYRFGAGKLTLAKMLLTIGVDAVVGSIPILGTLFDAVWKANRHNVRTLERYLRGP